MTQPRPKRLRAKHVISPGVGDNLLEIKEAEEGEDEEDEMLQARSRRVLPKTTFDGAQSVDNEETNSDEVIGKRERIKRKRQKQEARTGPSKRPRKSKSPAHDGLPSDFKEVGENEDKEEEHKEDNPSDQTGGSDVAAGIGDEKEEDDVEKDEDEDEDVGHRDGKEVAVREEEENESDEEEDESDEAGRPLSRKYHLGVLSKYSLAIPHRKMIERYADILMRSSSRGARRILNSLPPSHELSLVMRNVAELSALSGHSLRRSLRMDVILRRYRKRTRGVQAENERLHNTLDDTSGKLIKIVEKRHLMEARLPKQLDFMTKEIQWEYLESDEFIGMFYRASAPIFENGWRLGLA
ncbi:hypothetical protein Dimus_003143 [Dionaea muscipula]